MLNTSDGWQAKNSYTNQNLPKSYKHKISVNPESVKQKKGQAHFRVYRESGSDMCGGIHAKTKDANDMPHASIGEHC